MNLADTPPADALLDTRARCCGTCGHGKKTKVDYIRCGLRLWQLRVALQPCELVPVQWTPIEEKLAAKREAQAGIDSAVAAADRSVEGWSDTAYAFIELYCSTNKGKRCIGHDIVNASVERGVIQPGNTKAWGGPIQRAARIGLLKRVGYDEDPNRHGNPVPLWEVT